MIDFDNILCWFCDKIYLANLTLVVIIEYNPTFTWNQTKLCLTTFIWIFFSEADKCKISGCCRGEVEVFPLVGCYAALVGNHRRFGTAYRSRLRVSGTVAYREGGSTPLPPKALQNRAKLNPIVKTVKNSWIWDANTPRCSEKRQWSYKTT